MSGHVLFVLANILLPLSLLLDKYLLPQTLSQLLTTLFVLMNELSLKNNQDNPGYF